MFNSLLDAIFDCCDFQGPICVSVLAQGNLKVRWDVFWLHCRYIHWYNVCVGGAVGRFMVHYRRHCLQVQSQTQTNSAVCFSCWFSYDI